MALILTVILIEILTGAEVDIFVPSFPELQKVFHLSPVMVTLTLTVNFLTHCVSALVVGNLGDRYGRKNIILLGLLIFILGSICCLVAQEYWHLLFGRFLQGIGISGPCVLAYIILADIYPINLQQKYMGVLNGAITLAMAFAPLVGSYISYYFGWHGNFYTLLVFAAICFIMSLLFFPESKKNFSITLSLQAYNPILSSKKATYFISCICFYSVTYWIFIGLAPILYMNNLGVGLREFGFYQAFIAFIFAGLNLFSGYFLSKFGPKKCYLFSLASLLGFIIIVNIFYILNLQSPFYITLVVALMAGGIALPLNIMWPYALIAVENAQNRIAALLVSTRLILTSFGIKIASFFYDGTFLPISTVLCVFLIIGFYINYKLFRLTKIV